ncbi:MAG: tetratricopeptide repeat protein [Phycisphaerales bacterium]
MKPQSLDEVTYQRIQDLCAQGDSHFEKHNYEKALKHYHDALNIVPKPVEEWETGTWILVAIGDLHFQTGKYAEAITALKNAIRCPGGLGNPFIHLRLGEAYFESGDEDLAADELARAYMGAGRDIFAQENSKYIKFLSTRIEPPAGQDHI